MQGEWGATYWSYDPLGRPTRRHDPRGTVVTYAYGAGGHRTELTVEGQGSVYYQYGPTGDMDRLLDGKTGLFAYYEYDPAGRVRLQHHPNLPAGSVEGATATYFLYDAAGRLSEKVTKKDSDASVLVRFAYTRDSAGNPIAIEREAALGAFYYEYDALQRLAYEGQFISAARQYENYYEYDAAGNRTLLRHGETAAEDLTYYTYDAANELTELHAAAGWTYFAYDPNGNTVMEQAPSYTRYFDWDGPLDCARDKRDMLTGVRSTEAGWTDNVYRYDGLASRVSTLESGGLTYYDWDSINVIQEKDADGEVTDRQVHGHAPIFSVGDIALMDKSGTPYVPVSDQVGTTWNLLNSAASKANSYTSDAFGVGRSATETVSNLYRFGTKRLDTDPTLYHFVARRYEPTMGRFVSYDRLRFFANSPSYAFGNSAPIARVDPQGLQDKPAKQCTLDGNPVAFVFDGKSLSGVARNWPAVSGKPLSVELIGSGVTPVGLGLYILWWVYRKVFDYSVEAQARQYEGPIPAGTWWFDICEESGVDPIRRGPSYGMVILESEAWGLYRYSLHAEMVESQRVKGFFIHGGMEFGSAGCIDIANADVELHALVQTIYAQHECQCCYVPLEVRYAEERVTFDVRVERWEGAWWPIPLLQY
jgi:RHS repeat-associated protein